MLWRAVYCLATWLVLPLVFGYFAWRGRREPAYRQNLGERFGLVGDVPKDAIWVHAASVGEVVLIAPLVEALERQFPQSTLLITTMTPTGRERAAKRFGDRACIRYVPLDTLGATRRFIAAAAPRVGILVETELWPNLIAAADRAHVPLVLVNASVSQRSAERYARWPLANATRFMLARIAAIGAASEAHAQRFATLGAPVERVMATGNLKYDTPDNADTETAGKKLRRQWQADTRAIVVAASTHEGEEAILLKAFERLRSRDCGGLLVIAPRHPQRFDAVAELLEASPWSIARRSAGDVVSEATDIVLADTLGEVPMFYSAADVAVVGGSLVPGIGGHNVLEPAALGRPFCVGPYIEEWQDIVDGLVECGAARICATPEQLADIAGAWGLNRDRALAAGASGRAHVRAQAGALDRSLDLIDQAVSSKADL
jgi:3-deoxy-D-manno-octulosonic-acid transferase